MTEANTKVDPRDLKIPTRASPSLGQRQPASSEPEADTRDVTPQPGPEDAELSAQPSEPPTDRNPFRRHSLRGHSADLALNATKATPLPGKFIHLGQMTTIYAAPGTGKTLLMMYILLEAIRRGILNPDRVYYAAADDNSVGLATKAALLEEVGAHMMAPGLRGFQAKDLVTLLNKATEGGFAPGMCIGLDTLKKFIDLMDKKRSAEFAQVCRMFVTAGGTLISLAHTTKSSNADGTPRYQGTTDMLEDSDAVYIAQLLTPKSGAANKVVKFVKLKSRADCPEVAAYTYAVEPGLSYDGMVASVQPIDPDELDDYVPQREKEVDDLPVLNAIAKLISTGFGEGKMALARAAAEESRVSIRAAVSVLERYTGDDVEDQCLWRARSGPRGVQIYELLPPPGVEG